MFQRNLISVSAILILLYVLIRVAYIHPRWEQSASEATISWDVFGYYLYLPAAIIYDDLGYLGFKDELFKPGGVKPAGDFHHAVEQPDGRYVMKYPIGMAILYLPFFLLAHFYASIGEFAADGFSWPYQYAMSMGAIFYALMGLIITRIVLLRYFSDLVTAMVLGVIVLATNYLNYTAIDGAMPHNALFTFYALILYLTIRWHEEHKIWMAAGLGVAIGWATIIRPTELMSIMIPVLWTIKDKESLIAKWQLIWKHKWQVLVLGICLGAVGCIQLIYWKMYSGHFFYYSYEEFGFYWSKPYILEGLFSFRKGWLLYTPVMALSIIGFIPLFKNHRFQFFAVLAYVLLNIYVVFAWEVWWYGGSFGARALVQSYAVLALPLAACLTWLLKRKWTAALGIAFVILCADLNWMMTWQAHSQHGGWNAEGHSKLYYWKIFGSANPKKEDKKFLDVKRELKSTEGMTIQTLYENDFETDTSAHRSERHTFSGKYSFLLNKDHQFSSTYVAKIGELNAKPKSWIRVQAEVFYLQNPPTLWNNAQMTIFFIRDGHPFKATYAKIQRAVDRGKWNHYQYEMRIPEKLTDQDEVKVYVWNASSPTELYIDDFKVELIQPQD